MLRSLAWFSRLPDRPEALLQARTLPSLAIPPQLTRYRLPSKKPPPAEINGGGRWVILTQCCTFLRWHYPDQVVRVFRYETGRLAAFSQQIGTPSASTYAVVLRQ
jgi:hypothetical protein